jgi:molybdopterin-containing oxidoreductase family membrane subunit
MSMQGTKEYAPGDRALAEDAQLSKQVQEARQRHLLLDKRPASEIAARVLAPMQRTSPWYWVWLVLLGGAVLVAGATWLYQMWWGLGITGLNRPVMWAVYIANFVYFIGIGVAGTFISAVLRVLRFQWRAPITRAAETLTVFALLTSGLFPLIHLGRTWKFFWLLPYPNQRLIWPSYHSALLWDMTAIMTYLTCSILFTWLVLIPDLAIGRDRITQGWRHRLFNLLALGWRGTEREWRHLKTAVTVFSLAIIPVMILMHSIVGWDFAMTIQPGWSSTVFGPYFVSGALLSGAAAVIIVLAIARKTMHLEYFIRDEHFDSMGKFLLILSLAWAYFYFNDFLVPWYGQLPIDKVILQLFTGGGAAPLWWLMILANLVVPAATLWSRRVRTSLPALVAVSVLVNVGMYLERYLIVAVTLGRNELPFDWGSYIPHIPEILITVGAFSLIGFLFLAFAKLFPLIPIWEVYEGQMAHELRRIGRQAVPTRTDPN